MSKKTSSEVTAKTFKSRVAAVIRSGQSIRANIQELVQYAIVQYLDPVNNGNTADLTYLYQKVKGVRSLNSKTLGDYVEDTVNVALRKTSDGEFVFRKAEKGTDPALRPHADLSAPWWEHGRTPDPKAVDILKRLASDIAALESTQGDTPKKPLVAGQEVCVQEVINSLTGALAKAKALIARSELEAACTDPEESEEDEPELDQVA